MKIKQKTLILTEQGKRDSNRESAVILKAVSAVCITLGAEGVFFALGGALVFPISILAAAVSAAVIFGMSFIDNGKSYGILLCLLGAASVFFFSLSSIIRGLYGWADYFRNVWNLRFGTFYEELAVHGYTESDMLLTQIVMVLLLSAFVCGLIQKERLVLLTCVVYILLCLSFVLSAEIPLWAAAGLTAGWMAVWCCISGPSRIKWEVVILAAGVLALLCILPSSGFGTVWGRAAAGFQASVKQGIEKARFGEDTLPKGDLRKAQGMLSGAEERLELKMETIAPIYLRGFVGAEYEEDRWRHFSAKVYGGEFSGMLSWFVQEDFWPGIQYAQYRNISAVQDESESGENGEKIAVSVKNVGADRRYIYLPETAADYTENIGEWKQDWYMSSSGPFGRNQYKFVYYNVQEEAEIQQPDSWLYQEPGADGEKEGFRQAERIYRAFVYDNYLKLEEDQKELIDLVFFNGDAWEESNEVYTVTSRIRMVLRILASYEEIPARVPSDRDFLSWFLEEGKEGNSAYYATAAVLAYRAAGIPARYAEGYVLTRREAEGLKGNTVTLSGKNAHAWAEVYVDGMGWRTVEVTPGFYEEPYQADVVIAVPNEALEGNNGETAGIPPSEEYELPKGEEKETEASENSGPAVQLIVLTIFVLFLLLGTVHRVWLLYIEYRYRRMTGEEKMYFLYRQMIYMVKKMYRNFNPEQPLELPSQEHYEFDEALYMRTVKRVEGIIYGQTEPAAREIPAAEELNRQIRSALRRKLRWNQRAVLIFLVNL